MSRTLVAMLLGLCACATTEPGSSNGPDGSIDSGNGSGGHGGLDIGTGGEVGSGGRAGSGGLGDSAPRRIFVTDTIHDADLGGIDGADALCASQASAAGLEGEFNAWLSTLSSAAADRLSRSTVAYVLVDGTLIAKDWQDLTDGEIAARIDLDASGQLRGGDVWTGTLPSGLPYANGDCAGFTSSLATDGIALCGTTQSSLANWTANATPDCATRLRLFCIEQ
jgi:hypothetical protein